MKRILIVIALIFGAMVSKAQTQIFFGQNVPISSIFAPLASPTFTGTVSMPTLNTTGKITATLTTTQLQLGYDGSNYLTAVIGSTGSATLDLTGTSPTFSFGKSVAITGSLSVSGNASITGRLDVTDTISAPNIPKRVWMGSDAAVSTTSFGDVTGLQFPVVSGRTYWFKFFIVYTAASTATSGMFSINGPTLTKTNYTAIYPNATNGTAYGQSMRASYDAASSTTSGSASGTGANMAFIEGYITCSASGNVIARAQSETAGSAITVESEYSFVEYKVIN